MRSSYIRINPKSTGRLTTKAVLAGPWLFLNPLLRETNLCTSIGEILRWAFLASIRCGYANTPAFTSSCVCATKSSIGRTPWAVVYTVRVSRSTWKLMVGAVSTKAVSPLAQSPLFCWEKNIERPHPTPLYAGTVSRSPQKIPNRRCGMNIIQVKKLVNLI